MIKRIRFGTRRHGVAPEEFVAGWRQAVGGGASGPPGARPVRVTVCAALPGLTGADLLYDRIGWEWFTDAEHLARFESWLDSPAGRARAELFVGLVEPDASPVVVVDELVLRGAGWLDQRWRERGARSKHVAVARRADGLTPEELSERWRNHAGTIGGGSGRGRVIPDEVRGTRTCRTTRCRGRPGNGHTTR